MKSEPGFEGFKRIIRKQRKPRKTDIFFKLAAFHLIYKIHWFLILRRELFKQGLDRKETRLGFYR